MNLILMNDSLLLYKSFHIRELDRRYAMMQSKQFKSPDGSGHRGRSRKYIIKGAK